jgi:hypothetical protein
MLQHQTDRFGHLPHSSDRWSSYDRLPLIEGRYASVLGPGHFLAVMAGAFLSPPCSTKVLRANIWRIEASRQIISAAMIEGFSPPTVGAEWPQSLRTVTPEWLGPFFRFLPISPSQSPSSKEKTRQRLHRRLPDRFFFSPLWADHVWL